MVPRGHVWRIPTRAAAVAVRVGILHSGALCGKFPHELQVLQFVWEFSTHRACNMKAAPRHLHNTTLGSHTPVTPKGVGGLSDHRYPRYDI